ncbi:MAG: hypothetical protein OSB25_08585 [Salibacteraceae bacterium]|nr:hypothetical protein [Salibacteraceae bacterium]|tara:strand:- start:7397 stop:8143 length:747 start_codon:yes stop_codon:yes gene_type:complete
MALWIQAGLWGLLAGGALLIGAFLGYVFSIPKRTLTGIMAFGGGVLISALCFELVIPAYEAAGLLPVAIGFLLGGTIYSYSNYRLSKVGASRRMCAEAREEEMEREGSGTAIAVGALLDGIPESMAIGLTVVTGHVSIAAVIAIFISNIPEGISSAAGMKQSGRKPSYIFGIWGGIAVISGLASLAGYSLCHNIPMALQAGIMASAAGAILTMLANTMIPEAFKGSKDWTGLLMCIGFLIAFSISKLV